MDYYIRSWDPDSTYPPNPQEGDVAYTITLDQSWSPVAGVKNDNLVKTEIYTSGNWVEQGGGGGGGGDFKTVNVTLSADAYATIDAPQGDTGDYLGLFISENGFATGLFYGDGPVTEKLMMFGDSAACTIYGEFVSATGGASWDADNQVLTITGDCTVTLQSVD